MSCNSTFCAVSDKLIDTGDDVVIIILTSSQQSSIRGNMVYSWDLYSPVNIPLISNWNWGAGDIKPYQFDDASDETKELVNKGFLKFIQHSVGGTSKSMEELTSDNLIIENKELMFMAIHKEVYDKIVNEFGKEIGEYSENETANKYYRMRKGEIPMNLEESYKFVEGTAFYAGENRPWFTLTEIFELVEETEETKKYKDKLQLDFMIFNNFFQTLGKQYFPSMHFSECPGDFGYDIAKEFLEELRK